MLPVAHIIAGSMIGMKTANPILAFLIGFASHFILDSIPHWEYKMVGVKDESPDAPFSAGNVYKKSSFLLSYCPKVAIDFAAGGIISLLIYGLSPQTNFIPMLIGGAAAALPDIISGLGIFSNFWPLRQFRKFHHRVHYPIFQKQSKKIALSPWGLASQILVLIFILLLLLFV